MPYRYGSDPRADEPARGRAGVNTNRAALKGYGDEGDGVTSSQCSEEGGTAVDGSSGGGSGDNGGGVSGGGRGGSSSSGSGGGSGSSGDDSSRMSWALGMPGCGGVWEMPALPNAEWPSDHLAVGVELVLLQRRGTVPPKP
ncbi:hypothetical protein Vretifemale_12461 [Volvox reticuliferus]|uniref:Endonuclease/exonuclease/phosphatase domain-containing protein n=2 Tax=Volvox reticuliferus TaxID=1737510 RepID=A0A8J4CRL3_9CHLO|nr:hypothetical protein Vretifemale_12461 [Volvox reticuliferus]